MVFQETLINEVYAMIYVGIDVAKDKHDPSLPVKSVK